MKYSYKIIYDIKKDMWNWRGGVDDSFMGFEVIDRIKNDGDRQIAHQIVGLKNQPAEEILKPYLVSQKANPDSRLNIFIRIAEKDFQDKFAKACRALERITKRPMMSDKFTFYVTTFPRMPYFYKECKIFLYDSIEGVWGMPIDGFLHEALHFQFEYYWRDDKNSYVSRLGEDEFVYLKEALTIVLDEDLKPVITVPDKGYDNQAKFRKILYRNWCKYHDFDKLVEYGLKELEKLVIPQ